jgi:hypothetical protein
VTESEAGGQTSDIVGREKMAVAHIQLAYGVILEVRHKNAAPVVLHVVGISPDPEAPEIGPVARPQFRHRLVAVVGDPDVGSIECKFDWKSTDWEGPEVGPVARPQFRHRKVALVGHPDVCAVKCDADRLRADREGAEIGPVARPQFRYRVRAEVCDPHIGAVENDILRRVSNGKHTEDGPIAGHLGDIIADSDPDVRAIGGQADGPGPNRKGLDGEGVGALRFCVCPRHEKTAERERKRGSQGAADKTRRMSRR